jgi:hypothetical protein
MFTSPKYHFLYSALLYLCVEVIIKMRKNVGTRGPLENLVLKPGKALRKHFLFAKPFLMV